MFKSLIMLCIRVYCVNEFSVSEGQIERLKMIAFLEEQIRLKK